MDFGSVYLSYLIVHRHGVYSNIATPCYSAFQGHQKVCYTISHICVMFKAINTMGVSHRMCQNQCSWFGRAVRRRITDGTTLRDLRRILVEEWNTIPQIRVQRLIMSMRRRCQDVIAAHGGSTQARSYGGRGGGLSPPGKI